MVANMDLSSSVSELDRLFTSTNPDDVIEFYSLFEERDALINWMKNRPRSQLKLHEIDGDKTVVVIIPTSDFKGTHATKCRADIFNGLQIIFVENSSTNDPYFNFATSINKGVKRALDYNPRWVIYSNDDMYQIDDVAVLRNELESVDEDVTDIVFTRPRGRYHSIPGFIGVPRFTRKLTSKISGGYSHILEKLEEKFCGRGLNAHSAVWPPDIFYYKIIKFIRLTISFSILSGEYASKMNGNIMDDTYVNAMEDTELSLSLSKNRDRVRFINYRIGDLVGSSLGNGYARRFRSIASLAYFNYKIDIGEVTLDGL